MNSDEEKEEKQGLHCTVFFSDHDQWLKLAEDFHCDDTTVAFSVDVTYLNFIPFDVDFYVLEDIALNREKAAWQREDENDDREFIRLRTRIFRFDRKPTRHIVPSVSPVSPSQPYGEILWSDDVVSSIEIRGLENLISRGGGVANEAKRLADAVDVILSLSRDALKSRVGAQEEKPDKYTQSETAISVDEQIWRSGACLAAKDLGRRNIDKLTQESLAEQMGCSPGKVKNRKKSFPVSWPLIEAAFAEGKREYAEEKMSRKRQ